jgi:hypothetical protein
MGPDSNIVTGVERHRRGNWPPVEKKFTWIVQPDGVIDLGGLDRFRYEEHGATGELVDISMSMVGRHYVGSSSGQKSQMKWYTYTFTDGMKKKISAVDVGPLRQKNMFGEDLRGSFVAVGDYVLTEVTDLQLVMETHAAANVAWKVAPNELGTIFLAAEKPTGKTEIHFVKKPDGTWVMDSK